MIDTTDPTHWLHQSVHKAYPDLLKKLGAVVNANGRIECSSRFTFDHLYRHPENDPIFNATHLSAAEFITTLWNVAFERNGYARLREMIMELMHGKADGMLKGYCPMTLYVWTMRGLSPAQAGMVKRICLQDLRSNDIGWIIQCSGSIRETFEQLGCSIENSLDRMKKQPEDEKMKRGVVRPKESEPV